MIRLSTVLAFGAGVAAGLWMAKQYARSTVKENIHDTLSSFGLGGGKIENIVEGLADNLVNG